MLFDDQTESVVLNELLKTVAILAVWVVTALAAAWVLS